MGKATSHMMSLTMKATLVTTKEARPVRKKKPNIRYPAAVFNLN